MIHLFKIENGRLSHVKVDGRAELSAGEIVWIDAVALSDEEKHWLKETFQVDAEAPDDAADIEASARAYEDDDGSLNLRSDFLISEPDGFHIEPVRFVLKNNALISIHEEDLPIIRLLRLSSRAKPGALADPVDVLIDLFALDVEYSADALESIYTELKSVSTSVLAERRGSDKDAAESITRIAKQEDLNGTIRRNLMDTRRTLSFLMREQHLPKAQNEEIRQILRDIESLDGHTAFIFDKTNFLMDATIGFISINQSKVVKIFSVAAVAMLPPTLIASIYGMNFEYMPELAQKWGYPFSLALMVVSVVVPFWFFRRKGWLK